VLELLRPESTVTLCLPLFLAGEEQERRFAREHPTITVDGCDRLCAKRGTQQYSGQVAASLVVTEIVGDLAGRCHRSARDFDASDEESVWLVAERIAAEVDALSTAAAESGPSEGPQAASCGCSCGSATPGASLTIQGRSVTIHGLPLVFEHLYRQGLEPAEGSADTIVETVRIYHAVEPAEESFYRDALLAAYRSFFERRLSSGAGRP
jgi:uncharacterized metal-binding protein